ncbi:PREDICTED: uncharacterized protein LOC109466335 isoform X1 [Branchiostoma belcheri]|uniref:Uncharacterized protein LOC109466335 isoform X1 n=2 Tax=Branchiostoma belcheri TaxID=7741 RepID=A0A6P4YQV0_BRABE|nr:PREDICTED: uncharacterized protein LOC109466335 isoform X1 [Branchiostoma belcheri]
MASKERSYVEKDGMMGYFKKHKTEKDPQTGKAVEEFIPVSNFTFDIVEKVTGDHAGFLVKLTCHPGQKTGVRYIPVGARRDTFCSYANLTMGDQDWGCLTTSMPDMSFRSMLVRKQLEFEKGTQLKTRRGTTVVGKVKDEDIWIFNDKVQIKAEENEKGKMTVSRVRPDQQQYILLPLQHNVWTAKISLPLSLSPMKEVVKVMRKAFQHNFMPSMYVMGHANMSMHAELVASRFDSCPVTVAVGPSGLGKTMALKTALSMIGIGENGYLRQFKREAVVSLASRTTLGCFMDDPHTLESRKEAAVDFYGMGGFYTLSRGLEAARCGFLMTANHPLEHHEERDLRRLLYVPFDGRKISDTGGAEARVQLKELRDQERLSACMRTLVMTGVTFREKGWKKVLRQGEEWARDNPNVLRDTLVNYSVLHWFTSKICHRFEVPQEEVDSFWKEKVLPFVLTHMQQPTSSCLVNQDPPSVLETVRADIAMWITTRTYEELKDAVRMSSMKYTKKGPTPRIKTLMVTSEALSEASPDFPLSTIKEHLKASGEGLPETVPYKVNRRSKRFVGFRWESFTKDQQENIEKALRDETEEEEMETD